MSGQFWKARVRVPESGPATTRIAHHLLKHATPLGVGASTDAPGALDAFLSAIGSELLLLLRSELQRRGLAFESLELQLRAELDNPLVALGVIGESGRPGLARLQGVIHLTALFEDGRWAEVEAAWQAARGRSCLLDSLSRHVQIEMRLNIL